jgi:hypothetical protein
VAEKFGVLPSVVARDLYNDAHRTTAICYELLCYAHSHAEWHSNDTKRHERMQGDAYFEMAKEREAERVLARMGR